MNKLSSNVNTTRKSSATNDLIDRIFLEPLGMLFSNLFILLKFTPNAVTITGMLFGVAGATFFLFDTLVFDILGIGFEILSAIFDTSDGQVARLTHKQSEFGRLLDGFCDEIVVFAIYFALATRLMTRFIPFTEYVWGLKIWILVLFAEFWSHRTQCCMADYFRNLHLFFEKGKTKTELTRSVNLKKRAMESTGFQKITLFAYTLYTSEQEFYSPKTQILLDCLEKSEEIPCKLKEDFLEEDKHFVKLTALLTYNFRTIFLFIFIVLRLESFYFFPFLIVVMGIMKQVMISCFEKLSSKLVKKYFKEI